MNPPLAIWSCNWLEISWGRFLCFQKINFFEFSIFDLWSYGVHVVFKVQIFGTALVLFFLFHHIWLQVLWPAPFFQLDLILLTAPQDGIPPKKSTDHGNLRVPHAPGNGKWSLIKGNLRIITQKTNWFFCGRGGIGGGFISLRFPLTWAAEVWVAMHETWSFELRVGQFSCFRLPEISFTVDHHVPFLEMNEAPTWFELQTKNKASQRSTIRVFPCPG